MYVGAIWTSMQACECVTRRHVTEGWDATILRPLHNTMQSRTDTYIHTHTHTLEQGNTPTTMMEESATGRQAEGGGWSITQLIRSVIKHIYFVLNRCSNPTTTPSPLPSLTHTHTFVLLYIWGPYLTLNTLWRSEDRTKCPHIQKLSSLWRLKLRLVLTKVHEQQHTHSSRLSMFSRHKVFHHSTPLVTAEPIKLLSRNYVWLI